ncbi:hypothetical protein F5Y16DRAFT_390368 [Xylariaceae sp. FL0255]|nr:hypothetical protein F5Y16DRAFT_390368 [Xylariaceae sp. FL0255]
MKEKTPPVMTAPPEVVVHVFSHLPSLTSVLSLAGTCRSLRVIWLEHAAHIFKHVAPTDIEQFPAAAAFFTKQIATTALRNDVRQSQGQDRVCSIGASTEFTHSRGTTLANVTADDVRCMMRNARRAEFYADKFGAEVAAEVPDCNDYPYDFTPMRHEEHPPYLTSTERARFLRGYYRLRSLLLLKDATARRKVYSNWTAYKLCQTCELALLPYAIGEEEEDDSRLSLSETYRDRRIPDRRQLLALEIHQYHTGKWYLVHPQAREHSAPHFGMEGRGWDGGRFGVWGFCISFDHYQEIYRKIMLHFRKPESIPAQDLHYLLGERELVEED